MPWPLAVAVLRHARLVVMTCSYDQATTHAGAVQGRSSTNRTAPVTPPHGRYLGKRPDLSRHHTRGSPWFDGDRGTPISPGMPSLWRGIRGASGRPVSSVLRRASAIDSRGWRRRPAPGISTTYGTGPLPVGTRTVNIGRQANGATTAWTSVQTDADRPAPLQLAPAGPSAMGIDTAARPPYTRASAPSRIVLTTERRAPCGPHRLTAGRGDASWVG